MRKKRIGFCAFLCFACCVRAAHAEFGTGFGSGSFSLFFGGLEGLDAADGCLEALAIMAFALIVDLIRFILIRPVIDLIRTWRYMRRLKDVESLRAEDPAFDPEEVAEWARNLYLRLQREWEKENERNYDLDMYLQPVRDELEDDFLYQNQKRMDKKIMGGDRAHTSDLVFHEVSVAGWYRKGKKIILDVNMNLERRAWYTRVNLRKKKKTGGREEEETPLKPPELMLVSHTWRLSRPVGAKTVGKTECACGRTWPALYGECPGCGMRLRRPEDAWKLEKILEDRNPRKIAPAETPPAADRTAD